MKETNRMNVLLIELLVVILFFMLSATTVVRLFGASRLKSDHSKAMAEAAVEVENLAERLYALEDPVPWLRENGFSGEAGLWTLTGEDYEITAIVSAEETAAGIIRTVDLKASRGDRVLIEIPATRYWPGEVSP